MAAPSASNFPVFSDGDVRLIIPPGNIYQLHSAILTRNSGFFAGALTERNAAKLSPKAKKSGVTVRFQLQLVHSPANPNGVFQMKVSPPPPPRRVSCPNLDDY